MGLAWVSVNKRISVRESVEKRLKSVPSTSHFIHLFIYFVKCDIFHLGISKTEL